jgi:hypothetical protein
MRRGVKKAEKASGGSERLRAGVGMLKIFFSFFLTGEKVFLPLQPGSAERKRKSKWGIAKRE